MSTDVLIGIISALAWIPGIYGVIEAVRRHRNSLRKSIDDGDRMIVTSALELLAPYKERVEELEKKLGDARRTINDLSSQLDSATRRAGTLNDQLVDAQTELGYLRVQVKALSQQIKPS